MAGVEMALCPWAETILFTDYQFPASSSPPLVKGDLGDFAFQTAFQFPLVPFLKGGITA